jgi:hypothetical protein
LVFNEKLRSSDRFSVADDGNSRERSQTANIKTC